jgi:hypothetical protein
MSADPFLSRWMRRKSAARRAEAALANSTPAKTEPSVRGATSPAPSAEAKPLLELPRLDSLKGLNSDYQAFMQPHVDQDVKQAALRQLFADPHFNEMDGLDVYIDDYGLPDPIPAAMLAGLAHAQEMLNMPEAAAPARAEHDAAATTAESAAAPTPATTTLASTPAEEIGTQGQPEITDPASPESGPSISKQG